MRNICRNNNIVATIWFFFPKIYKLAIFKIFLTLIAAIFINIALGKAFHIEDRWTYEPPQRFELWTDGLQNRCSTTELRRRIFRTFNFNKLRKNLKEERCWGGEAKPPHPFAPFLRIYRYLRDAIRRRRQQAVADAFAAGRGLAAACWSRPCRRRPRPRS